MPKKKAKKAKKTVKKVAKKVTKRTTKKVTKKAAKKTTKKCACKKVSLKIKKPLNKSQVSGTIAEMTCISKKDISCCLDALFEIIGAHLKKSSGPGEFTLPGVAKFRVVRKPATKARKGINPFTGESMVFKAKPARNIVKVRALKKIKDIAK